MVISKLEKCYYCNVEQERNLFKENYDDVYFICNSCFSKKEDDWLEQKEFWIQTDYQYDEWD